MYTEINFKSKKALKEYLATGKPVATFQPGPFPAKTDGSIALEGPHYPEPHRWYASATVKGGFVVPGSVK